MVVVICQAVIPTTLQLLRPKLHRGCFVFQHQIRENETKEAELLKLELLVASVSLNLGSQAESGSMI